MIEKLPELVNNNEALIRRGRWLNDVFLVEVGEIQYLVHVAAGRVECVETGPFVMPSWTFAIRGSEATWTQVLAIGTRAWGQRFVCIEKNRGDDNRR